MSAFDARDGARSAASKCYRLVALARAIQGGEAKQRRRCLKFSSNWRGHDDVMQTRSIRGSGEPAWVNASSNACFRLGPDPRIALWPAARFGSEAKIGASPVNVRFVPKADIPQYQTFKWCSKEPH